MPSIRRSSPDSRSIVATLIAPRRRPSGRDPRRRHVCRRGSGRALPPPKSSAMGPNRVSPVARSTSRLGGSGERVLGSTAGPSHESMGRRIAARRPSALTRTSCGCPMPLGGAPMSSSRTERPDSMSTTAAEWSSRTTTACLVSAITAPAIESVPGTYRFPKPCAAVKTPSRALRVRASSGHRRYASAAISAATSRSDPRSANDVLTAASTTAASRWRSASCVAPTTMIVPSNETPRSEAVAPNRTRRRRFCRRSRCSWRRASASSRRARSSAASRNRVSVEVRSGFEAERQSSVFCSRTPRTRSSSRSPSAPCVGRRRQLAEETGTRGVLLEPVVQTGPSECEEFVRHCDGVVGRAQESRPYEAGHHGRAGRVVVQHARLRVPAQRLSVWAELDEPKQRRPAGVPLRRGQIVEQLFGGAGDRAAQASDLLVARDRQHVRLTPEPGLDEGVRATEVRCCDRRRRGGSAPVGRPRAAVRPAVPALRSRREGPLRSSRRRGARPRRARVRGMAPHCIRRGSPDLTVATTIRDAAASAMSPPTACTSSGVNPPWKSSSSWSTTTTSALRRLKSASRSCAAIVRGRRDHPDREGLDARAPGRRPRARATTCRIRTARRRRGTANRRAGPARPQCRCPGRTPRRRPSRTVAGPGTGSLALA